MKSTGPATSRLSKLLARRQTAGRQPATGFRAYISICMFVCALQMWLPGNTAHAQSERDLQQIKRDIRAMAGAIEANIGEKNAAETSLRKTEKEIATLSEQQAQTRTRISKNEKQIEQAGTKLGELKQTSDKLKNDLGALAQTSYRIGQQPYIKLALSQQNPSNIDRLLTYFRYLADARTQHIQEANVRQKTLTATRQELELATGKLDALRSKQTADAEQLTLRQDKRKTEVAALNQSLTQKQSWLDELKAKEARIKRLLQELATASRPAVKPRVNQPNNRAPAENSNRASDKPAKTSAKSKSSRTSNARFAQMQNKLRLPVNGKIQTRFRQKNRQSGVPSDGLLIAASAESPVKAVYGGQIAYADWFRGFGQLVIVDHGGGFMSLYSHNSRLAVQIGERVQTGDTIAAVGDTGGLAAPGLYFEIRENGTPRDPLLWCAL